MAIRPDGIARRQLRTLFHLGTIGHLTDGQLLERFATRSGSAREMAFAALVDRHGPLVLRVCRTVLRDEHDAQDAFQATFVVLVRKGKTLWVRETIGPWLHAVALRAARGARASRERRRVRERGAFMNEHEPIALPVANLDDLGQALHEEIERLPARFRTPIILCDLEGLTHDQAAQAIGCPVGTIKSRLSRARSRLRDRLTRRGLAPVVGVGASLITTGTRASVPGVLAHATIEIATQSAAGTLTGALVPAAVAGIAGGVSHAMMFAKLKLIAVPVLAVGVAAGAGLGAQSDEKAPAEERGPVAAASKPREEILLYEVKPERLETSIEVRGNLDSSRMSKVNSRFEEPMTIRSMIREGTRVKAGDVVCELDTAGFQDRLAEQRIAVERATADVQNAKKTLDLAELNVQEYLEGVFPQELKTIEGEIRLAQSQRERAKEESEISEKDYIKFQKEGLFEEPIQLVNKEIQLQILRYDLKRADFALEQAEKKREVLVQYIKAKTVTGLEADVDEAMAFVLAAEESLNLERENARATEEWIEQCTIVAPEDGMVLVMLEGAPEEWEGSSVRPRQLIFRIFDVNEPMQANVKVPAAWVDLVKIGDRVQIKVDAFPNRECAGRVSEIKPLPDPMSSFTPQNRVYTTIVDLDEPHPGLRPGLTLSSRLHVSIDDTLSVPARAVLTHEGVSYVALRTGFGRFEWREVSVGLSGDGSVGISEGLEPGDLVAVNPITVLRRDELKRSPDEP